MACANGRHGSQQKSVHHMCIKACLVHYLCSKQHVSCLRHELSAALLTHPCRRSLMEPVLPADDAGSTVCGLPASAPAAVGDQ
jgi:hypothetical protein